MNLEKIKNLVILMFIGLNIILLAIGKYMDLKYQLSGTQLQNIESFLSERRIAFYTDVITEFRPKPQLDLDATTWMTSDRALTWLFGEGAEIRRQEEFRRTTFESGADGEVKTLSFVNGQEYEFEDPSGSGALTLDLKSARSVCEEAIERLGIPELKYEFDFSNEYRGADGVKSTSDDELVLEYRVKFDGRWVHCSYIIFTLTEKGIVALRFALVEPLSYADAPKAVYAPDEALMALYYELELIYGDDEERDGLRIDKMDMVYDLDFGGEDGDRLARAVPCYRIYIDGRNEPFLINAFFNTVMGAGN
jgi:hypothetical protein